MTKKILIRPIIYASKIEYMSLIPEGALQVLQDTLESGLAKHPNNDGWDKSIAFHLDRIVKHIIAYHNGDTSERHLEHIFTRGMMMNVINTNIKMNKTNGEK